MYSIRQCTSESQALADLRGEENQYNIEYILSVYEDNSDVNIPINWFTFFIGGGKILPDSTQTHFASLGELKIIFDNKEGYNSAMAALGENFQIEENTILSSSSLQYTTGWLVWAINGKQIVTRQASSAMGLFVAEY